MSQADAPTSSSTASDLLSLVRQHDEAAWQRFVDLYGPMVYGWCRRGGLNSADAGDVMQDVFCKVFAAIGQFRHDRPGDTLRGWLRVICRNQLNDYYRRNGPAPLATGGSDWQKLLHQIAADNDDEPTVRSERQGLVRRAAELVRGEFEPRTWQAFWMVAVDGWTAVAAAAQLGLQPGAARQAKYMVLRRLRDALQGEFE